MEALTRFYTGETARIRRQAAAQGKIERLARRQWMREIGWGREFCAKTSKTMPGWAEREQEPNADHSLLEAYAQARGLIV